MGQSRTEFARRRRAARENRPNFLAVLDEATQMVVIQHSLRLGDEAGLIAWRGLNRYSCRTSALHYPGKRPFQSRTYRCTGTHSGAICLPRRTGLPAHSHRR